MRQLYAYDKNDANESTRRFFEDEINTHTTFGFFVPYVFARKQCILCAALRHKSFLHHYMLHRFEVTIHSALSNFCARLQY